MYLLTDHSSSQPVLESVMAHRKNNRGRKLKESVKLKTRPDAEGIGIEQEKA